MLNPVNVPPKASESAGLVAERSAREAAIKLESAFLSEMLKSAGLGKSRDAYGGGSGEDQFSSFLIREQAEQMTRAGGIGLAEYIFKSLMENPKDV